MGFVTLPNRARSNSARMSRSSFRRGVRDGSAAPRVDNRRVGEASCAAGRLRGESRPVPRSRIRKRRCNRQACRMIGDRQRNRDLTIVLFAEPPTILSRDADRMRALLRKTGVIDDPGFDPPLSFDARQNQLANLLQKRTRPTRALGRPDVKAIDVWRKPGPAPRSPPSARRSCVRPASAGQRNNHLRAQRDRRGR